MTAKPPLPQRLTREQYYELGRQDFFDGKRVELIRGEVVELSPINIAHARGVGLVHDALRLVLAVGSCNNPSGSERRAWVGTAAGRAMLPEDGHNGGVPAGSVRWKASTESGV